VTTETNFVLKACFAQVLASLRFADMMAAGFFYCILFKL